MATADQIKALVRAHIEGDNSKFKTIVLQIAASEARQGHGTLAQQLKKLVSSVVPQRGTVVSMGQLNPMVEMSLPKFTLNDLVVNASIRAQLLRVLDEYRNRNKLAQFGLQNRRKILLEGPPGTGKTFTSSILASELRLPLYTVQFDKILTKFMGETSVKLRQLFDYISDNPGVYLFDEFDAIGANRALDNEVGEMRRVLNSFLQFIEDYDSTSLIIAATNNEKLLDHALFRRFDDVLHYSLPDSAEIGEIFLKQLRGYQKDFEISATLVSSSMGLSQAELVRVCQDAIKASILSGNPIATGQLLELIKERTAFYSNREA